MRDFIKKLQEYQGENVFNPWAEYDTLCDIGPQAPTIRSANLERYLKLRQEAKYLFLAEALGYQGGHFSGMAMTSERILLGNHPQISPEVVLGEAWQYQRTSNPSSMALNEQQRKLGFNEPTATVMWGQLARVSLAPYQCILWNIFPFHPYKSSGILTNRTPTKDELDVGYSYLQMLLALLPKLRIIAIGRKSAETLARYGLSCDEVRHPSMGGATAFKNAVSKLWQTKEE